MPKASQDDFDESALYPARPAAPARSGNPLAAYFRVPGLHVHLPTGGAFLPPGTYHPTVAGDIPALPMRSADEILLRSPDALMSGYAIEKMLESCVPSITAPMDISLPDIDVLFLAIRASTYGDTMEITTPCPKDDCKAENAYDITLSTMLETCRPVPPEITVRLSDEVIVFMRPYTLRDATTVALATYQETRKVQAAEEDTALTPEQRSTLYNASFKAITDLNTQLTATSVIRVVVPGSEVTDRTQIGEFITNMSRNWYAKLDAKIKEIHGLGLDKKVSVVCNKCHHEWETEVQFDPASFFAHAS